MPERPSPPDDIAPEEFFTRWIPGVVAADSERQRRLGGAGCVLLFELEGEGGGLFHLRVCEGAVEGYAGAPARADLRVRLDIDTWRDLNRGALSAPEAFLRRRVRLEGNLALALKLHLIIG
jgi:putative sterol carrier protein